MPSFTDFPARGKVTKVDGEFVTFHPVNTTYELKLSAPGYTGPVNVPIEATIRVKARRLWTVPSGGNFISPIFGPPKTIQGKIRAIQGDTVLVQAGVPILVELPANESAYDCNSGQLGEGTLINVVAFAGGTLALLEKAAT